MDKSESGQSITGISSPSEELDHRSMFRGCQYKGAVLTYQEGHMTLTCVVRDFSDLGARIQIVGAVTPPDQFTLKIDIDAIWVVFEVIWRDGNWLGVRFKDGVQKIPTTRGQVFQNERKCSILRRSK